MTLKKFVYPQNFDIEEMGNIETPHKIVIPVSYKCMFSSQKI